METNRRREFLSFNRHDMTELCNCVIECFCLPLFVRFGDSLPLGLWRREGNLNEKVLSSSPPHRRPRLAPFIKSNANPFSRFFY